MNDIDTNIDGLKVVQLKKFVDNRGWFTESYNREKFNAEGINVEFIQDNHSLSILKGTLRGLHLQRAPFEQSKLVRCTKGRIFDVAVDLRPDSSTFMKYYSIELSETNMLCLFMPKGFAHGFLTLSESCEVQYKIDEKYNPDSEVTIKFDDSTLNIDWPYEEVIQSTKDKNGISVEEYIARYLGELK